MIMDLHNHTKRCNHATGETWEYVERAIEVGIDIFGFTCHAPMNLDKFYRMGLGEVSEYLSEIRTLREKYSDKIAIKIGFEVDFIKGKEELIEPLVLQSDVDYLIGSVHFLARKADAWGFDNPEYIGEYSRVDIDSVWIEYLEAIAAMAQSGHFNIVGHFDLLKIFNNKPKPHLMPQIRQTLESIKDNGMALELNTAGLRKQVAEIYPSREILEVACQMGIPITFSSDAHAVEQVGFKQDYARKLAREIGFKNAVSFSSREMEVYEV